MARGERLLIRPVAVYKHERTWRWDCRRPHCHASDWASSQPHALAAGIEHQRDHNFIGFRKAR
jgi:hypothetical protein